MKIYNNMKVLTFAVSFAIMLFCSFVEVSAQEKNNQPDIYEQAEMEADRLQRLLDLEDWQVFYVDSTLKHDFPSMMAEIDKLRNSKVSNMMLFQAVQDKWMDQIDATYKRIFNPQQWAAYLKTGAAKAQKAREKRKAQPSAKK